MSTGFCFSGGGGRGAFQVGVLEWVVENGVEAYKNGFDLGSGTSVGAVNAVGGAMRGRDLGKMTEFLIHCWEKLEKTSDVWKWKIPPVAAGVWNTSVGDNSPLRKLLLSLIEFDAVMEGPQVWVTAWDLVEGKSSVWNLKSASSPEELVKMVLASSSFPIAFPPEPVRGSLYTDGGVSEVSPLKACVDAGANRVLAVVCQSGLDKKDAKDFKNVLDVGFRVLDGMGDEILKNDLKSAEMWNALVQSEHSTAKTRRIVKLDVIRPAAPLGNSLDFSAEATKLRRKLGREAARNYFERITD